jgi:hypothetical protein
MASERVAIVTGGVGVIGSAIRDVLRAGGLPTDRFRICRAI